MNKVAEVNKREYSKNGKIRQLVRNLTGWAYEKDVVYSCSCCGCIIDPVEVNNYCHFCGSELTEVKK